MKDYKEKLKNLLENNPIEDLYNTPILENFIDQLISERDKEWEKKYTEVKIRVKESNFVGWEFFSVFVQAEDKEFFERKFDRAMKAEVDYQVEERLKTLIK